MTQTTESPFFRMTGICKSYRLGDEWQQVLRNVDLSIEKGEFLSVLGPSGSGKSTLMNIIGCLDTPTEGEYILHGKRVDQLDENQLSTLRNKEIGFIFQSFQLLPRQDALSNVELPLIYAGMNVHKRRARAEEMLCRVGLEEKLHHMPNQLSGGQQQRVAIARALVKMPRVLLLDEPLSNLDARLRLQTREEIKRIQKETGITTIFVTHDQEEAMSISDMIVVMKDGIIQQIGAPQEVYDDPINLFVAKFLGTPPISVFSAHVKNEKLYIGDEAVLDVKGVCDREVVATVRPEGFDPDEQGVFSCALERVEVMGRDMSIVSTHPACEAPVIRAIINSEDLPRVTSGTVRFNLKPGKVFLFDSESGERIAFGDK